MEFAPDKDQLEKFPTNVLCFEVSGSEVSATDEEQFSVIDIAGICMQTTDHHIIFGADDRLLRPSFSPAFFGNLSPDQSDEISGKAFKQRFQRMDLQKEINDSKMDKNALARVLEWCRDFSQ